MIKNKRKGIKYMISSYRDPYGNINAMFKVATARAGDVYMTLRDCSGDFHRL
ncbi:hypothetical protein [Pseudoalteromonas maricaloris]|uniref:hypothetical protein n=1 Tax=Pseudoalteromonas maricaloris TaxID=184924 RepID=UPI003C26D922